MQQQGLNNQIEQLLHQLSNGQQGADDQQQPKDGEPEEIIDVYFVRREAEPEEEQIIDATPQKKPNSLFTPAILFLCLILPISSIFFQVYLMFNPPTATVTIISDAKQISLNGTLHIGRLLHPITLLQSQTVPTTGKGHQDPTRATGELTFYNGQVQTITIPAGTVLTGSDGTQIVTDQDAIIPGGNPPTYGQATVTAHAVKPGSRENISAGDINTTVAIAVIVKNTLSFSGGQDERNYQIVTKSDIANGATPMKTTLAQSTQGALEGQLKAGEQLITLPCAPTMTADHHIGDEATRVTITVSETCTGAAYNTDELQAKAQTLLSHSTGNNRGSGYSLFGDPHVINIKATINQQKTNVFFSFTVQGTYLYALQSAEQEQIKQMIAGKTIQDALHLLSTLPGIKSVTLQWDENTKLPKDTRLIHLYILVLQS